MRNKSKKPLGGVFHGHDWCPKNPITKRIIVCKIDICSYLGYWGVEGAMCKILELYDKNPWRNN